MSDATPERLDLEVVYSDETRLRNNGVDIIATMHHLSIATNQRWSREQVAKRAKAIVRAVNSHDALVEAAEAVLRYDEDQHYIPYSLKNPLIAALAAAKDATP